MAASIGIWFSAFVTVGVDHVVFWIECFGDGDPVPNIYSGVYTYIFRLYTAPALAFFRVLVLMGVHSNQDLIYYGVY